MSMRPIRTLLLAVCISMALAACSTGPAPVFDRSNSARDTGEQGGHVVRRGETVYGIAQRYGVSTRALIEWNKLRPPYVLIPGQRLQLPEARTHIVQRGEYIYQISRRYGVDMASLVRLNNIRPPYTIRVGQRLKLPVNALPGPQTASRSSGPATTSSRITRSTPEAPKSAPRRAPAPAVPVPPRAGGKFAWPVDGRVISRFGATESGLHNDGMNIAAPFGAPVRAAENGVVAYAGSEIRGFGNMLLIKHEDGLITAYAHADRLLVKRGDVVSRGQVVARVGRSGGVDSPQLHFEVRRGTEAVNPGRYLPS